MDLSFILKYRRECDCWICPECDTENDISVRNCTLCGETRNAYSTVIKKWTKEDERRENGTKAAANSSVEHKSLPSTDYGTSYTPPEKRSNALAWVVIAMIVIIAFVILGQAASACEIPVDSLYSIVADSSKLLYENDYVREIGRLLV